MAINFPNTPTLNDTHSTAGKVWKWDGTSWIGSADSSNQYVLPVATTSDLGGVKIDGSSITIDANGVISSTATGGATTLTALTDTTIPNTITPGHVLKWDGSTWSPAADASSGSGGGIALTDLSANNVAADPTNYPDGHLGYNNITGQFTYTVPSFTSQWQYADVGSFPAVGAGNAGALGYAQDINVLYYSNGSSWTNNRIVVTDDSNSSDFATLLGNYQRTYTLTVEDHTAGSNSQDALRKIVKLADNEGNVSEFVLAVSGDIAIGKTTNQWGKDEVTFGTVGGNYSISSEVDAGPNDSLLRLTDATSGSTDEVKFAGADGLSVERTDEHTITFRNAPTATQYTDDMSKDAAFAALNGGTHQNITFTYDSVNKVINANATGTGGGGGGVTYDLQGANNTSNQAIVQLIPSTGTTDTIEFAGGDGTTVSWDSANKKITITSKNYQVGTPAAANGSGSLALVDSTFTYTPPDLTGYLQSVPQASATVLGGIKVGANLTMDAATGELSAVQGNYTLYPAGVGPSGTLGGVKVDGSSINIDGNGVISSTGGSTVPQIGTLTGTSSSIADGARGELSITGHKGYVLYKITVDVESWVRIYCDDATRQYDRFRSEGNDPGPGSGVIAECRTSGPNQDVLITPGIMGFNNDNPRTDTIYLSINNRSGSASAITVTLTALKIGE